MSTGIAQVSSCSGPPDLRSGLRLGAFGFPLVRRATSGYLWRTLFGVQLVSFKGRAYCVRARVREQNSVHFATVATYTILSPAKLRLRQRKAMVCGSSSGNIFVTAALPWIWLRQQGLSRRNFKLSLTDDVCGSAFIAGGIAACGAVTATHPFETVKIRLQLQGELQAKDQAVRKYRGVFHGVSVIAQNEGIKGLYRGIGSAYVYQILLNGCRLGFYEPLRKGVSQAIFQDAKVQSLGVNIFSGAASGILGALAGSPFFLVKTRLQSYSPFLPVGTQHPYKNSVDGLRQIYGGEGSRGLYRGVGAAMIRTGFGSSVQLPTYFFAKRRLIQHLGMEDGPALHLASSTASGFVVCCVMHPPGLSASVRFEKV